MIHLPALISDLAIILVAAGAVTLFFKKIKQPVVLGYLLAGVLVGPEISFLPTVQDKEAIKIWAEIGVIVLLFGLGLEFSFKKLAAIGRGASITALTEIIAMLGIGYLIGQILGWNAMDSLFLGGILSISSTTIIIRAFDELGLRQRKFVNLVFGVLIVEDLVAILLLVLLSTIAVSKTFEGIQLLSEALRLGFFLIIWFIGGIFLLPLFLRKVRESMNAETSLVVSLGLCFMMVVLATQLGFSPALGAFIMGSILAETPDGEKIEHNLVGVKNLFAAVFFVSIGMLIEVKTLQENWGIVLVLSAVTIVGKMLTTTLGAVLSGQSLRHSVQAGMSLAQIGEFSFIIATLGMSLNVTSDFLYPIAVAVSAITTFTTPYLIRSADTTFLKIEKLLPKSWAMKLSQELVVRSQGSDPFAVSATRLVFNSVIVIAIALASSLWVKPIAFEIFGDSPTTVYSLLLLTVLIALPFLWAIILKSTNWRTGLSNHDELRQLTTRAYFSLISRTLLSLALLGFIVLHFVSAATSFTLIAAFAIIIAMVGSKNFTSIYHWLESHFLAHLNEKERKQMESTQQNPILAPWDAHLSKIPVHPESAAAGKTLLQLELREKFGVTIALIERGKKKIVAPGRDTLLMAHDRVFVIGTDDQLTELSQLLGEFKGASPDDSSAEYGLTDLQLTSGSLIGKSIRNSGLREETGGLVVGIERNGERILNPDSTIVLQNQDRLWIVGNLSLIEKLRSATSP